MVASWMAQTGGSPESEQQRGLCIYGIKGCGKSVLATSLHEELVSRDLLSALFCFWDQSESLKGAVGMLSTLLWQLMKKMPEESFDKVASEITRDLPLSVPKLLDAIDMAVHAIKQPTYLIIDGIDESSEDWGRSDLGGLHIVSHLTKNHQNIRILVLGREPSLRPMLKSLGCPGFEMTHELVREDMDRFAVTELQHVSCLSTDELRNGVRSELLDGAEINFLWVKLVVATLRGCYSIAEIYSTLRDLPHSLDDEYHRAFRQLAKRAGGRARASTGSACLQLRRIRTLFSLIVAAAEPLTLYELQHAYAMSAALDPSKKDWKDHLLPHDGIMAACGDFIRVTSGKVHLGHSSVLEFLTRPAEQWRSQSDIAYFRLSVAETHQATSVACVDYLRLADWGYPLVDDSFVSLAQRHPFLQYAHRYAAYHFLQSKSLGSKQRQGLHAFLSSRGFCKWFEYLLLHAVNDFTAAEHWVDLVQFFEWHLTEVRRTAESNLFNLLVNNFSNELARRQRSYGVDDPRTTSWRLVQSIANAEDLSLQRGPLRELDDSKVPTNNTAASTPRLGASNKPAVKALMSQQMQEQISRMSRLPNQMSGLSRASVLIRVVAWMRRPMLPRLDQLEVRLFDIMLAAATKLPVLVVTQIASYYRLMGDSDRGRKICAIAVERSRGTGSLDEAAALGYMAGDYCQGQARESHFREAMDILSRLPRRLFNDLAMAQTVLMLGHYLLWDENEDKEEEGVGLYQGLAERLMTPVRGSSRWEDYFRGSDGFNVARGMLFMQMFEFLEEVNRHQEAADILEKGIGVLRPILGRRNWYVVAMQQRLARESSDGDGEEEVVPMWCDKDTSFLGKLFVKPG